MSRLRPERSQRPTPRRRAVVALLAAALVATLPGPAGAGSDERVTKVPSGVVGSDGARYSVTNHLTRDALAAVRGGPRREWLLVWAGDAQPAADGTPDPDFLAVVDATPGARTYGRVVNTVTLDSTFGNEPHHMQYVWHKGDKVFAGGILSDTVYVFDVSRLPVVKLSGITLPSDTPCGSVPDAFVVLSDGNAYGTLMGGPDVSGTCTYSNGETRVGNGFGGTPGAVVHLDRTGRVLSQTAAAVSTAEHASCLNIPELPEASCANPHGIAVREDLDLLVTSDFAEVRNLLDTDIPPSADVLRDTIRVFDISDRSAPRLRSVSRVPDGPRVEPHPVFEEFRATMEVALTHRPGHRGAFASTMGGAVFYTPDITAPAPRWREVFDDTAAFRSLFPTNTPTAGGDVGSWIQVSPDDGLLYHVVMGGGPMSPPEYEAAGMMYVLDIRPLLRAGSRTRCSIDDLAEVETGGVEKDCPKLVSALPIFDETSGGPHWAAMDNFTRGPDGRYRETSQIRRLALSNYFVARAQIDGDHRVCLIDVDRHGRLSLDRTFRDEHTGAACVHFDRDRWPHGAGGAAQPHGVLFTVADRDLR